AGPGAGPSPSATAVSRAPDVTITQPTCCTQTARALLASWESNAHVNAAKVTLTPDPGFECSASIDANGLKGTFSCRGLLKGATADVTKPQRTPPVGPSPLDPGCKTTGSRLPGVKPVPGFGDPAGRRRGSPARSADLFPS